MENTAVTHTKTSDTPINDNNTPSGSSGNNSENKSQHKKIPFAVVEAYKTIRTNLLFALSQNGGKSFVITSPIESEGKSTTAVNSAIAFSQLFNKVLLIDGDMRRPVIHKKCKVNNKKGLSSVLVGFDKFEDAVNHVSDSLDVLPSGPTPPNPVELLGSQPMTELLESLKEKYDYIIFDAPPITVVSDALVLAPKTDGMVMVVRDHYTTHDGINAAMAALEFCDIHLLGIILNACDVSSVGNYKYKKKYYSRYRYNRYGYSKKYGYSSKYGYASKYGYYGSNVGYGESLPKTETVNQNDNQSE